MQSIILSLVLFLPLALGAPDWRVINGTEAESFEFKSVVALWKYSRDGLAPACGGTLIAPFTILTAAHCFSQRHQVQIHINAHDFNNLTEEHFVLYPIEVIRHPLYNEYTLTYDFAIIKFNQIIPNHIKIEYAPLPPSTSEVTRPGDECVVVGWGSTDPSGRGTSSKLMKGEMKIISNEKCRESYPADKKVEVCAESKYISTSACHGDSGGPLFCKSSIDGKTYQAGVVSKGKRPCGQKGAPIIYARVAGVMDWIKANM